MSIEGQGHFLTIYFPGFACFVLYKATISDERLQDHRSSGFKLSYFGIYLKYNKLVCLIMEVCYIGFSFHLFVLNSISSNIIVLRHYSVYHQIAGSLSIQDLSL